MFTRYFVVLFCLTGIHDLCLAETLGLVPRQKPKNYAALSAKTKELRFGPFFLQAEDVSVRIKRDAQTRISLKGDAHIICGKTRLSADRIEVSYKDQHDQLIVMQGDVEIENEREQLRMFAREAILVSRGRYLTLKSRNGEHVRLIRTSDQQATLIEGSMIHLKFQNLHTMLINSVDNASIKERPTRSVDRVTVKTDQPSKFDFFDDLAITSIKVFSEDWSVRAKKPYLHD